MEPPDGLFVQLVLYDEEKTRWDRRGYKTGTTDDKWRRIGLQHGQNEMVWQEIHQMPATLLQIADAIT